MKTLTNLFAAAALMTLAAPAVAAPIVSLPGGSVLTMGAFQKTNGPTSVAPGVTFTATNDGYVGYEGAWGFEKHDTWEGAPLLGLNSASGSFTLNFDTAITGFLAEVNWAGNLYDDASITAFDMAGNELERIALTEHSMDLEEPGFFGFANTAAPIKSIRFSNSYIAIRNLAIVPTAAVPEPATWAMMLLGFGMMGATLRYRRKSTKVSFA
ncbi:PEPxxWA-CTERM sorting domain-containing protein [Sphingomonas sp.]|jgi:hypothetical protein|uniref:PEPxxWA-CTERM sorting domain-containing protein n=1 Tax=Sphingomonas sp. TaxID=28214 RepID=UPI002EDA7DDA